MIFGDVPLDEAEGAILAHSVRTDAVILRKGRVLEARDIVALKASGLSSVCVARLEEGDVGEDEAALEVCAALCGNGLEVSQAVAGRCNLHARVHGVLEIDRHSVDTLNAAGDGVLCATLPQAQVVEPGRTVATVKVVPYAIERLRLDALCGDVGSGALRVRAFKGLRIALVLSEISASKPGLLDKARDVLAARVETYGGKVVGETRVAHDVGALADAVDAACESAEAVLVLGGASSVDVKDTVPAAIQAAGGDVELFGIPVDPGNLLSVGRVGSVSVLGLPGCARSPKMNGVDLILPRLFAGLDIGCEALMGLGVGGLLHDVSERPQPREPHIPSAAGGLGGVGAVMLAAGASKRMGTDNKLLQTVDGRPMVRRVAEAALASAADSVIVVTGHEADRVRRALSGLNVHFVHNPSYEDGLSTSVRIGVGRVPNDCMGAMMLLGDMPKLTADTLNALIARFRACGGRSIIAPVHKGRRGNPVVWPREFFADMMDQSGDVGARRLLKRYADRIEKIEVDTPAIFLDVDTPDDLDAL